MAGGREWRVVADYPAYEVSDCGVVCRRTACNRSPIGKVMREKCHPKGYRLVALSRDGVPKWLLVHRIVCSAFHGAAPSPVHHAAHCDGNPSNNHALNLRWATASENQLDRRKHATMFDGDTCHLARLNREQVEQIRSARGPRGLVSQLAAKFGVSHSTISRIRNGEAWRGS